MAVTAQQLKTFREGKGLSITALAKLIGADAGSISKLENGHHKASPVMINRYRRAGFRPQGRPPASIPIPEKIDTDAVILAEKILRQWAPHLLDQGDPIAKALHSLETSMITRLEAQERRVQAIQQSLDALAMNLVAVDKVLMRYVINPAPDPDLQSPDGGPEKSGENA